jgi:hypothetical protein
MSLGYNENTTAQNNNIIVPASTVEAAIRAFAEDRASQRAHEAQMVAAVIAFTVAATDKLISFAREEAAQRRADRTAELREEIEALRATQG